MSRRLERSSFLCLGSRSSVADCVIGLRGGGIRWRRLGGGFFGRLIGGLGLFLASRRRGLLGLARVRLFGCREPLELALCRVQLLLQLLVIGLGSKHLLANLDRPLEIGGGLLRVVVFLCARGIEQTFGQPSFIVGIVRLLAN